MFHGLGQNLLQQLEGQAQQIFTQQTGGGIGSQSLDSLGLDKIIAGLKEALNVGATKAIERTGVPDGFLQNALIKICLPPKLKSVGQTLRGLGLGSVVDDFEASLNHAAEDAAPMAKDIFAGAITQMTFDDAKTIWKGGNNRAATLYLQTRCTPQLKTQFAPIVQQAMQKNGTTQVYANVLQNVQHIPFVHQHFQELDIEGYTVDRGLAGLFEVLGEEEEKIRVDPVNRVTQLLQEVFSQ